MRPRHRLQIGATLPEPPEDEPLTLALPEPLPDDEPEPLPEEEPDDENDDEPLDLLPDPEDDPLPLDEPLPDPEPEPELTPETLPEADPDAEPLIGPELWAVARGMSLWTHTPSASSVFVPGTWMATVRTGASMRTTDRAPPE